MLGAPHLEVPATILCVVGVAFVVLCKPLSKGLNVITQMIWSSPRAKELAGYAPKNRISPKGCVILGVAWIISGVILFLVV